MRSYDPQIGRFLQNDPDDQFACGCTGMGNDPVNNVDPSGGTAGGIGMAIGFAAGSVAGWMMADNNGAGFWGKLGAAFGGGFIGAGVGYAVGESLSPGALFNESRSFLGNLRGFYHGLFNGNEHIGRLGNALWSPNIWGSAGEAISTTVSVASSVSSGTRAITGLIRSEQIKSIPDPAPPNITPKPLSPPTFSPPGIPPKKPQIRDINISMDASYGYDLRPFERSLSEEQSVFTDGIINSLRSRCKGVLKLSRIDISVPTNEIAPLTLNSTVWGGSVGTNRFGSRIERFMVSYPGYRTPPDGNGFSGLSNLMEQGRRMGGRIAAAFGGSVRSTAMITTGAKFIIRVQGKCIE